VDMKPHGVACLIFFALPIIFANGLREAGKLPGGAPGSVQEVKAFAVGGSGESKLYYWVIAVHRAGKALPSAPAEVAANSSPSRANPVLLEWQRVGEAEEYDILRTDAPVLPDGGTCECAVARGIRAQTLKDEGGALTSYAFSIAGGQALGVIPAAAAAAAQGGSGERPGVVVNVRDNGARGDGVTDDTAAIQATLDAAPDGATVVFPAGEYRITRSGNSEWSLVLKQRRRLSLMGTGRAVVRVSADITSRAFWSIIMYACEDIRISGLEIVTTLTGQPTSRVNAGILLMGSQLGKGSRNISVEGNRFTVTHPEGMSENRALYGLFFVTDDSEGNVRLSRGWAVLNNEFQDCEGRLVQTWKAEDVVVAGNTFRNSGPIQGFVGIRIIGGAKRFRISHNTIEDSPTTKTAYGIVVGSVLNQLPAEDGAVTGNLVISRGADTEGIRIYGTKRMTLSGNVFAQDSGPGGGGFGIRIDPDEKLPNRSLLISGNVIYGWKTVQVANYDGAMAESELAHNFIGSSSRGSGQTFYDPSKQLSRTSNYIDSRKATVSGPSDLRIEYGDVAPSSGSWVEGDIVLKPRFTRGGSIGWVCVSGGSPGTWRQISETAQ
jgi:hypothetical protein